MARINIKNGTDGIKVEGGSTQRPGVAFTVSVRINNTEHLSGILGAACKYEAPSGEMFDGHLCDVEAQLIGPTGVLETKRASDVCAPRESRSPDPLIEFDFTARNTGDYTIRATVEPNKVHEPDSEQVDITIEEVGSGDEATDPGDESSGSGNGDYGFGGIVNGDGDDDGSSSDTSAQLNLLATAIENPIGTAIVTVGGAYLARQLVGGE